VSVNEFFVLVVEARFGGSSLLKNSLQSFVRSNNVLPDSVFWKPQQVFFIDRHRSVVAWDGVDVGADVLRQLDERVLSRQVLQVDEEQPNREVAVVLLKDVVVAPRKAPTVHAQVSDPLLSLSKRFKEAFLSPSTVGVFRVFVFAPDEYGTIRNVFHNAHPDDAVFFLAGIRCVL